MDSCSLCDLPVGDDPVVADDVDGTFCCRGCLAVTRSLGERDAEAVADPGAAARAAAADAATPAAAEPSAVATTADANGGRDDADGTTADAAATTYLHVDGMHCATCETFLEATARRTGGVVAATASYATDTVRVRHDPDRVSEEDLASRLSVAGYAATPRADRERGGDDVDVVRFLIGGGLFGMMTMLWYALFLYPTYLGFEPFVDLGGFDGLYLFAHVWVFSSIVLFYTGYPILRGAYVSLRARQPNMDLLVALAATNAYLYSTVALVLGRTHLYFDVTVAIVLVVTAGNHYETLVKRRATGLLSDLTESRPTVARLADGEEVPVSALAPGDELLVKPGERVPLDGTVVEGTAAVDESLVTGESLPATKRPGDDVRGGTVVTDAPVRIAVGPECASTLDRIVELLWDVQSSRSGVQRLADRLSTVFVPLVVALAAVTFVGLLATGASVTAALLTALTVLIVTCPCALGLATPLAVAGGVRDAAERGIVVTADAVFEDGGDVETVVFDKTGTLTDGAMRVVDVTTTADDGEAGPEADAEGMNADAEELLARAAALERAAAHPVAAAIVEAAERATPTNGDEALADTAVDGASLADVTVLDRGVRGGGTLVGHPELFDGSDWEVPDGVARAAAAAEREGDVPVVVGWDGVARGVVRVGDRPRPGWDETVEALADAGKRVVVLSGDTSEAAAVFERHPAVDEVYAEVPPEAKEATVERLRHREPTAMVGDGSNDAPALAAADLGIALAGGTDLAVDAADAVVLDGRLSAVPELFDLTRGTNRRIRVNLGWAFCYNAVAIPLAVAGALNPLLAAAAMATSSLLVVGNSVRPVAGFDAPPPRETAPDAAAN